LDGLWIAFGFLEARHFPKLASALELGWLTDDPNYSTPVGRGEHMGQLVELIDSQVIQRDSSEWIQRLKAADVPCTVIQDYHLIRHDAQALANGYVNEIDHPKWGKVATQGPAALLSKTPATIRRHAPVSPGDDTTEILEEAGFAKDEIATLAASGVVVGKGLTKPGD
jgi:crotonobetainyl-CoA:carnitine CoA-transferase CaiB-like acyl-CoA transferase